VKDDEDAEVIDAFSIDIEEDPDGLDITNIYAHRGDRGVTISIQPVVEDPEADVSRVLYTTTTVDCDVLATSLERRRMGFKHPLDQDTVLMNRVEHANIEDVIAALQWLIGKDT
jgi:hypothetical protein